MNIPSSIINKFKEKKYRVQKDKFEAEKLKNALKRLNEIKKEYQQKSIETKQFFLMNSLYAKQIFADKRNTAEQIEYWLTLFEEWDTIGSIPLELGEQIEKMILDPTIKVAFHRTGKYETIDTQKPPQASTMLQNIFISGLKNMADLFSSGKASHDEASFSNLGKTFGFASNMLHAVMYLKNDYQGTKGTVLACFPAQYVDAENTVAPSNISKIYTVMGENAYVKPEYLVGYIATPNGNCTYYNKTDFVKENSFHKSI